MEIVDFDEDVDGCWRMEGSFFTFGCMVHARMRSGYHTIICCNCIFKSRKSCCPKVVAVISFSVYSSFCRAPLVATSLVRFSATTR